MQKGGRNDLQGARILEERERRSGDEILRNADFMRSTYVALTLRVR